MSFGPGDTLDNRYKLVSTLGEGGMGQVFLAKHITLRRRVAIKLVRYRKGKTDPRYARAVREARIAALLRSPHSVKLYDVFEVGDDSIALVMEHLKGEDLAQVLKKSGTPSPHLTVAWSLQAAEALAEAHALGLIHRDVKLANIFLAEDAAATFAVRVLDFGIAYAEDDEADAHLTGTQDMLGSPAYMAPEQITSARLATPLSDIWGLGVCMYALLSGKFPHGGENVAALLVRITTQDPIPLREARPDVDERLADIVMRCLERAPAKRYQSMADLADALGALHRPAWGPLAERVRLTADAAAERVATGHFSEPPPPLSAGHERPHEVAFDTTTHSPGVTARPPEMQAASSPVKAALIGAGLTALIGAGAWRLQAALSPPPSPPPAAVLLSEPDAGERRDTSTSSATASDLVDAGALKEPQTAIVDAGARKTVPRPGLGRRDAGVPVPNGRRPDDREM